MLIVNMLSYLFSLIPFPFSLCPFHTPIWSSSKKRHSVELRPLFTCQSYFISSVIREVIMPTVIRQQDLIDSVADALQFISYYHPVDFIQAVHQAYEREQYPAAK